MAIRSQFFDSVDSDRVYTAADFSVHLAGIYSNGYIQDNDTDGLKVTQNSPTGKSVRVSTGKAFIQGRFIEIFGSPEVLTVPDNNLGGTRRDAVFLRVDFVNREARVVYKTGTTASRPTFVRDNTMWELQLANIDAPNGFTAITNANIEDQRNDLFLCGKSKPTTLRQNFQNAGLSGWRRIAVTNGFFRPEGGEAQKYNIAFANFMIRSQNDVANQHDHLSITVGASNGNPILRLNTRNRNDGGRNFDGVRLVYDPTGADTRMALEVFVTTTSAFCIFEIYENYSENGWFPVNWTAGSIPAGFDEIKLDFTINDMVIGAATNDAPINAFGVLADGSILSTADVQLNNDQAITGEEVGGMPRNLIKMNTDDQVEVGNSTNPTMTPNDLLLGANNKFIQGVETDGTTVRSILGINNFNNITAGNSGQQLVFLSSGLGPQFFTGGNFYDVHHAGYVKPNGRINRTTDQAIPSNTVTVIDFDNTRWDTHNLADLGTNRFTITAQTAGFYNIFAHVEWEANLQGARLLSIRLNGTTTIASTQVDEADSSSVTVRQTVSTVYQLAAGDFLELVVFHSAGGALDIVSVGNFSPEFGISFVSPM